MDRYGKAKIVWTILLIVSIGFIFHTVETLHEQQEDIQVYRGELVEQTDMLFAFCQKQVRNELKTRSLRVMNTADREAKVAAIRNHDVAAIRRLFQYQYDSTKAMFFGFEIMHFIGPDGVSIFRMHDPQQFGDDLTVFRPRIARIIGTEDEGVYYDVGRAGMYFRYLRPLMDEGELIGYLELGVRPHVLLQKISNILKMKSYFFLNAGMQVPMKESYKTGAYQLCKGCEDPFITKVFDELDLRTSSIVELDHEHYISVIRALKHEGDQVIGKVMILRNVQFMYDELYHTFISNLMALLLSLALIYLILNRYVDKILKDMDRVQLLLNNTNDAVYLVRLDNATIADVNQRAEQLLGYTREELLKMNVMTLRKPLKGDTFDWEDHVQNLRNERFILLRGIHIRKDGSTFPIESSLSYVLIDGEEYMIAIARDITEQLALQDALAYHNRELERMQAIVSESSLYTTSDLNGNITYVSDAMLKLTGYTREELLGKNHRVFKDPDNDPKMYKQIWRTIGRENKPWYGEIKNRQKDGEVIWIDLVIKPLFDESGKKIGYSSYRENITDKKRMLFLSEHDPLTGAFNRRKGNEVLDHCFKECQRYDGTVTSLLLMDIDHFKAINDTYGHQEGDKVLQELTALIHDDIREVDYLIRWGGEEFLIVLPHTSYEEAKAVGDKLREKIAMQQFASVGSVTCSFGLSVLCREDSLDEAISKADENLYRSKEMGRNRVT